MFFCKGWTGVGSKLGVNIEGSFLLLVFWLGMMVGVCWSGLDVLVVWWVRKGSWACVRCSGKILTG